MPFHIHYCFSKLTTHFLKFKTILDKPAPRKRHRKQPQTTGKRRKPASIPRRNPSSQKCLQNKRKTGAKFTIEIKNHVNNKFSKRQVARKKKPHYLVIKY